MQNRAINKSKAFSEVEADSPRVNVMMAILVNCFHTAISILHLASVSKVQSVKSIRIQASHFYVLISSIEACLISKNR
jgi:hypothetical protein